MEQSFPRFIIPITKIIHSKAKFSKPFKSLVISFKNNRKMVPNSVFSKQIKISIPSINVYSL